MKKIVALLSILALALLASCTDKDASDTTNTGTTVNISEVNVVKDNEVVIPQEEDASTGTVDNGVVVSTGEVVE